MFIATEHRITDLDTFSQKAGPALGQPPAGMRLQTVLLDRDDHCCRCIWEADSIESVQNYLEPELGSASATVYYLLDPETAIG